VSPPGIDCHIVLLVYHNMARIPSMSILFAKKKSRAKCNRLYPAGMLCA
jgi:hypothetical protein